MIRRTPDRQSVALSPLVVTPRLDPRETAIGYTLRLTQANGYHSPGSFLSSHQADSDAAIGQGAQVKALAKLALLDEADLGRLDIRSVGRHRYTIMGHQVSSLDLDLVHHKICPICIGIDGVYDASWHLRLITHCAIHRVRLVQDCSGCGKSLTIHRSGPGLCRCGATIAITGDAPPCDAMLGDLFKAIRARLIDDDDLAPEPARMRAFGSVGLPALLTLVRRLRSYVQGKWLPDGSRTVVSDPDQAMAVVALALCRFDEGIESMQAVLAGSDKPVVVSASSTGYGWYTRGTPRLNLVGDLNFLGEAMNASLQRERHRRCPPSTLSWVNDGKWIEVGQALALTTHDVGRVSQLIRLKLVNRRAWIDRGRRRHMVLKHEIQALTPSAAIGLETDAAADLAGLRPLLFARLARSPIYRVKHVASSGGPFAMEDVDALARRLRRLSEIPVNYSGSKTALTLGRALQHRWQGNYSAAIIRAVQGAESSQPPP